MSDQGERFFIELIRKKFPGHRDEIIKGIGDDAMIMRNGLVISTDSFFDGVHFDRAYFSLTDLGHHCMAASLSDLAAMAARPICALIALNLTGGFPKQAVQDLYAGFERMVRKYRMDIAGGDIVASPCLGMTITVIGYAKKPLLRSGAKPGQGLYVTNLLGLAEVGRIVLKEKLATREYPDSVNKHLLPEPRITEAQILRKYITSAIDTSDGLSTDAYHLAEESKVKIVIDAEHIPIHPEIGRYCNLRMLDPTEFILSSGEDFELLFTAWQIPKLPSVKVFRVGRVMRGRGLYLSMKGSTRRIQPTGYEHLKG
jgi:thiamine-monophosphate kinase